MRKNSHHPLVNILRGEANYHLFLGEHTTLYGTQITNHMTAERHAPRALHCTKAHPTTDYHNTKTLAIQRGIFMLRGSTAGTVHLLCSTTQKRKFGRVLID